MYTIDVETHDPHIGNKQSSSANGSRGGRILCLAFKHDDEPTQWLPWGDEAKAMFRHILTCGEPVLGHNLMYELCWAQSAGVWDEATYREHPTVFIDTALRASLLRKSPNDRTSLDAQAGKYALPLKPADALWDAIRISIPDAEYSAIRRKASADPRAYLWKIKDQTIVGDYCAHDVQVTYDVWLKQQPAIAQMNNKVFVLEETLLPILSLMQFQGIPVSVGRLNELHDHYKVLYTKVSTKLNQLTGLSIKPTASNATRAFIGQYLEEGLKEFTPKGGLALGGKLLAESNVPEIKLYNMLVMLNTIDTRFVCAYLLAEHNGFIYPSINQVALQTDAGDSSGASTGRFSYSKPTLQNLPAKGRGHRLKGLFRQVVAHPEHSICSADLSQQEPRWIVHYAKEWGVEGVDELVRAYNAGSPPDSHDMATRAIYPHLPKEGKLSKDIVERNIGKAFNLATGYGGGAAKLSKATGLSLEDTRKALELYWRGMPHLKGTMDYAKDKAMKDGFVETWAGRRVYFELYEPDGWRWYYQQIRNAKDTSEESEKYRQLMKSRMKDIRGEALPYSQAHARYASRGWPIKRSNVHKALNAVIQGSSADQIKLIIIRLFWKAGVLPLASIHDEILVTLSNEQLAKIPLIVHIMEEAIKLHVPMVTEPQVGKNWYSAVKYKIERIPTDG